MAVVTLLSDFIDGTSMALAEDTDAADLNAFMTANQGRLWASVQQRRRQRQQTIERRGPGTVYFAADAPGAAAVERYLGSETGSTEEAAALQAKRILRKCHRCIAHGFNQIPWPGPSGPSTGR